MAGACADDRDDGAARRREAETIVAMLTLRPVGSEPAAPEEVRSKGGLPYFVATGIFEAPRDAALQRVRAILSQTQWSIRNDGPVPHFLGWEIRASKASEVVLVSLGQAVVGVATTPYQPLADTSYVQVAVAKQNSSPEWSRLR